MGEKREYKRLEDGFYEDDFSYKYLDKRGTYQISKPVNGISGTLPSVHVAANDIPSAWELAMLSCWDYGARVGTHYDPTKDTPKSKEGTIMIKVANPFNEPRIHKNFPGGPEELEIYRQEVVDGIHNHWIDPKKGKWTYTYNERMTGFRPSEDLKADNRGFLISQKKINDYILSTKEFFNRQGFFDKLADRVTAFFNPNFELDILKNRAKEGYFYLPPVDQIEKVIDDLQRDITSKGAQAITWMPTADPGLESNRPCLQRLWFRVLEDDKGEYVLNLNTDWRSRDLGKAWFMNVYAITDWQKNITERLSNRINKPVRVGSYCDKSDSLHIYGAYFSEMGPEFEKMRDSDLSNRVWNSDSPAFTYMVDEVREKLKADVDFQFKDKKL